MAKTENLNLETEFLGVGPNAEAALAENFKKIDEGAGGVPSATSITVGTVSTSNAAPVANGDTLQVAIGKLQAQIDALNALNDSND